jgi:hypothetical protein
LRDAVELEWAGIPSVAIVHETMESTARAMASVSGMAGYEFVTVGYPHVPLAVWTAEEVDEVARLVAPAIIARLTKG